MPKIDKKEAVGRLLAQAVKLHFNNGDEYATHLLLMSAFRICRDLIVKTDPIDDVILRNVKPEYTKLAIAKFFELANYLKHADRDADVAYDNAMDVNRGNELLIVIVASYYETAFSVRNKNWFVYVAVLIMIKNMPRLVKGSLPEPLDSYLKDASEDQLRAELKRAIQNPEMLARSIDIPALGLEI